MVTHGKLLAHYGNVIWLNANMRTYSSANATSNGGDASRVGKRFSYHLEFVSFLFVIPTRDASPPLVLAFGGCVL